MELFSKNYLGKAPLFASNIFNIIKKPFTLCTNTNIHKVVYSIGRISELRYLEWLELRLSRGFLEESYSGNVRIYFLKYMVELSYQNKDNITSNYL